MTSSVPPYRLYVAGSAPSSQSRMSYDTTSKQQDEPSGGSSSSSNGRLRPTAETSLQDDDDVERGDGRRQMTAFLGTGTNSRSAFTTTFGNELTKSFVASSRRVPQDSVVAAAAKAQVPSKHRIDHTKLVASQHSLHIGALIEMYLFWMLYPLSLPPWLLRHGAAACHNMDVWPTNPMFYLFTAHAVAIWCVIAGWIALEDVSAHPMPMVSVLLSYSALRFAMASEYAFMTPARWQSFISRPSSAEELLVERKVSWVHLKLDRAKLEMSNIESRLGLNLAQCKLTINSCAAHRVRALLPIVECSDTILESGQIPIKYLLPALFTQVTAGMHLRLVQVLSLLSGVGFTLVSASLYSTANSWFDRPASALGLAVYIVMLILLAGQITVLVLILVFGLLDNRRRFVTLQMYSRLFCTQEDPTGPERDAEPPIFSLLIADNVRMYLLGRRLIMLMGQSYLKQWEILTSVVSICIAAMSVVFLFFPDVVPLYGTGYVIGMLTIPSLCAVYWGARINSLFTTDHALLVARASEAWDSHVAAVASNDDTAAAGFQEAERVLTLTASILETDSNMYPLRILGFRATDTLIKSVLVGLFSAGSLLAKLKTTV